MDEMEPLAPEVEEAKQVDEDMYGAMAPKGRFTDRGMNILVQATNKLLPSNQVSTRSSLMIL